MLNAWVLSQVGWFRRLNRFIPNISHTKACKLSKFKLYYPQPKAEGYCFVVVRPFARAFVHVCPSGAKVLKMLGFLNPSFKQINKRMDKL